MPIYEYKCTECGEKVQKLENVGKDSSGETCPVCRKGKLKKVFSLFGTTSSGNQGSCGPSSSGFS